MIEKAYGSKLRGKLHKKNHMPNQDNYLVYNSKSFTLAVVCDGMGGLEQGEIASSSIICRLTDWFENKFPMILYNDFILFRN